MMDDLSQLFLFQVFFIAYSLSEFIQYIEKKHL